MTRFIKISILEAKMQLSLMSVVQFIVVCLFENVFA